MSKKAYAFTEHLVAYFPPNPLENEPEEEE
jgi:hypothetical protein